MVSDGENYYYGNWALPVSLLLLDWAVPISDNSLCGCFPQFMCAIFSRKGAVIFSRYEQPVRRTIFIFSYFSIDLPLTFQIVFLHFSCVIFFLKWKSASAL